MDDKKLLPTSDVTAFNSMNSQIKKSEYTINVKKSPGPLQQMYEYKLIIDQKTLI